MKYSLAVITVAGAAAAGLALSEDQLAWPQLIVPASAQHGPAQMRAELDNAYMQVLRIRIAPHEKTGMHDVSPRLVVWITDAHIRDMAPDGTTNDYKRLSGAIEWVPARRHAGENLTDKPIEFVAVIPKSGAAPAPLAGHRPE
jgi:hypothetical protein